MGKRVGLSIKLTYDKSEMFNTASSTSVVPILELEHRTNAEYVLRKKDVCDCSGLCKSK